MEFVAIIAKAQPWTADILLWIFGLLALWKGLQLKRIRGSKSDAKTNSEGHNYPRLAACALPAASLLIGLALVVDMDPFVTSQHPIAEIVSQVLVVLSLLLCLIGILTIIYIFVRRVPLFLLRLSRRSDD
jgi:putative Mn2+ efflux pump MntP